MATKSKKTDPELEEEEKVEEEVAEDVAETKEEVKEIEKEVEAVGGGEAEEEKNKAKSTSTRRRVNKKPTPKKEEDEPKPIEDVLSEGEPANDEPAKEKDEEEEKPEEEKKTSAKKTAKKAKAEGEEEITEEELKAEEAEADAEAEAEDENKPDAYYMEPEVKPRRRSRSKKAAEEPKKQEPVTMGNYLKDIHDNPTISITGTIEAETAAGRSIEKLREMTNSMRTGSYLSATVAEVPANREMPHVVVYYGPFRVLIPADRFLVSHEGAKDDMTSTERSVTAALNRRIGSEIDFVVTNIDADNHLASGDRIAAMDNIRKQILGEKEEDGTPVISVGRKMECRVLCVYSNGLFVEAKGMEGRIPRRELSWVYSEDESYAPGDKLEAKIIGINDSDPENPFLSLSVRQCDDNPFDIFESYIRPGDRMGGRVVKVTTGDLWVRLDNGMFAHARPTADTRIKVNPSKGTPISMVVEWLDHDNKVVHGKLTYIGTNLR